MHDWLFRAGVGVRDLKDLGSENKKEELLKLAIMIEVHLKAIDAYGRYLSSDRAGRAASRKYGGHMMYGLDAVVQTEMDVREGLRQRAVQQAAQAHAVHGVGQQ
jgi:hypothetical protein